MTLEDPIEILKTAREFESKRNFASALTLLEALYDSSGTRFALLYMKHLGEEYPPALAAMEHMRERSAEKIRNHQGEFQDFCSVEAVSSELQDGGHYVYQLYREMMVDAPELARKCRMRALQPIIEMKDYELAVRLFDPAQQTITPQIHRFNQATEEYHADRSKIQRDILNALSNNLCRAVRMMVQALRAVNRAVDADELIRFVENQVQDSEQQRIVQAKLHDNG